MEVHFDNLEEVILSNLAQARKRISAAVYLISNEKILDVLIWKLSEGVAVELIMHDTSNIHKNIGRYKEFIRRGGVVLYNATPDRGLMHHKFAIIDLEKVICGSANWTYSGANRNFEFVFISEDSEVTSRFSTEFLSVRASSIVYYHGNKLLNEYAVLTEVDFIHCSDDDGVYGYIIMVKDANYTGMVDLTSDSDIEAEIPTHIRGVWHGAMYEIEYSEENPYGIEVDSEYTDFELLEPELLRYQSKPKS